MVGKCNGHCWVASWKNRQALSPPICLLMICLYVVLEATLFQAGLKGSLKGTSFWTPKKQLGVCSACQASILHSMRKCFTSLAYLHLGGIKKAFRGESSLTQISSPESYPQHTIASSPYLVTSSSLGQLAIGKACAKQGLDPFDTTGSMCARVKTRYVEVFIAAAVT